MPLNYDPLRIYLCHSEDVPDWEQASEHMRCHPGVAVVERLAAPEKQGSLYIPSRAQHTYHNEEDDPVAGFEPNVGVVLSVSDGEEISPGDRVIMRDGDGLEFAEFQVGGYRARQPVMFFGRVVPEGEDEMPPGYVEDMPLEESIIAVLEQPVDSLGIKLMTGRNILLERDEEDVERKTESGIHLPDVVAENAASIATVVMVGKDVEGCKPGDRVVYHPMACQDFFDPENKRLRVVREMAILTVI